MNAERDKIAPGAEVSGIRATRAIVDLDAIAGNVRALRAAIPARARLMAVVKADGYGHGAPWVASAALEAGAAALGVATVGEGQTLRDHGFDVPIVLLGSIDPLEVPAACAARLEITVAEDLLFDAVQQVARSQCEGPVRVHLKVDTGLRRYGAACDQVVALAVRIVSDERLRLAGVATHFASADEPEDLFTLDQLRRFEQTLEEMRSAGIERPPVHAANSAGILTGRGAEFDMVRAGIALYGVQPSSEVPLRPGMRPALRLESRIARMVPLDAGDSVGYNRTFRAPRPMAGALVPIGYADGYRRALSGSGWVGIGGRRCPVLGRVSMDQIVVEAPAGVDVGVGTPVHVLGGEPASGAPSAEDVATLTETNAYEILVGIRQRVPRIFIKDGQVIGVRSAGRLEWSGIPAAGAAG